MRVRRSLLLAVALDVLTAIAVIAWVRLPSAQLPPPLTASAPGPQQPVRRIASDARRVPGKVARRKSRAVASKIPRALPPAAQRAGTSGAMSADGCPQASPYQRVPRNPIAPLSRRCVRNLARHPRRMFRDIERRTFDYFWTTADPVSGLTPDRWPHPHGPASISAVGFALTADVIGAYRGYVTRHAAAARVRKVLAFLLSRPQGPGRKGYAGYHGFFYHFLNMHTGLRYGHSELSTIDTALLMAGVLTAGQYFDQDTPTERQVRRLARKLYRRVNWGWAAPGPSPLVSMAWWPGRGFSKLRWRGYNEASILYILGLGSPTHPLRKNAWGAWSASDDHDLRQLGGLTLLSFGPQFGFQYTAVWVDLRGIADPFMRSQGETYFLNGVIATLVQRRYAIINPHGWAGYGPDIWGLTACDGPGHVRARFHGRMRQFYGYAARGISKHNVDDGTLAPTAVLGSLLFAPRYVTEATQALLRRYGDIIYTRYGFLDSFNPSFTDARRARTGHVVPGRGWVDSAFLGIDQGPIIAMIENQRSRLIWRIMRDNSYIRVGLLRAGFTGGWLKTASAHAAASRHARQREPARATESARH